VTALTTASGGWLRAHGFLSGHGALHLGRTEDAAEFAEFAARFADTVNLVPVAPAERISGLRRVWSRALLESSCMRVDVAGMHSHYLNVARTNGAALHLRTELEHAVHDASGWVLRAGGETHRARVLVNAAGAWADEVARRCGVRPLGIIPHRRTMVQVRLAQPLPAALPVVFDINGKFYFKAEGRDRLWLSPQDETPSPACDVAPEELDVAVAIDRLTRVVDWEIAAVERRWAGLRSFAPDRLPVYGFDTGQPRFFWCAGQGGFGIQTAPAAAQLCAALLLDRPHDVRPTAIDAASFSPERFG